MWCKSNKCVTWHTDLLHNTARPWDSNLIFESVMAHRNASCHTSGYISHSLHNMSRCYTTYQFVASHIKCISHSFPIFLTNDPIYLTNEMLQDISLCCITHQVHKPFISYIKKKKMNGLRTWCVMLICDKIGDLHLKWSPCVSCYMTYQFVASHIKCISHSSPIYLTNDLLSFLTNDRPSRKITCDRTHVYHKFVTRINEF